MSKYIWFYFWYDFIILKMRKLHQLKLVDFQHGF
jgi:hypothetical protein